MTKFFENIALAFVMFMVIQICFYVYDKNRLVELQIIETELSIKILRLELK